MIRDQNGINLIYIIHAIIQSNWFIINHFNKKIIWQAVK